jgi:hypothetical protein
MKRLSWQAGLAVVLVVVSVALYCIHFGVFGDAHHIFIYLLGDIAFLPIDVLLVTLILHELLRRREKSSRLNKMNMVIGAFFSEVGDELMRLFFGFDAQLDEIRERLQVDPDWSDRQFTRLARSLAGHPHGVDARGADLEQLRVFLAGKRAFLLALMENPNLLEHESFTDLMWAVFHLGEELDKRPTLRDLPDSDLEHLSGDIRRAYGLLLSEWLSYMKHLKSDYPYLFSLATRTNPFDTNASPVVT